MLGASLVALTRLSLSLRSPAVAGRLFRRAATAWNPGAGGPADTAPDDTAPDDTAPDDAAHRTARRLLEEAGLL
ncbi:hypothetical protein SAMN06272775_1072 [Streptomyces sp. 2323.1]|uniref:hypothetical protein n=1 Tax=Streptomyces sp. 2323.1 TaxID=1938841 RepID=UPI000BC0663C|nr:hypothetical protein [Streptomyces sp. 2323.1]SOE10022.1 hypothetical protein SAMN06272775_1072 [Streptomyces sp. 2323.1]